MSTSAVAWSAADKGFMERFEASLTEIATRDNDDILNATRWGDKRALAPDEAAERAGRSIVEVYVGRSSVT